MIESKFKRTKNSITSTVIDGEKESKIIQKIENGKACINIEIYENGELVEGQKVISKEDI